MEGEDAGVHGRDDMNACEVGEGGEKVDVEEESGKGYLSLKNKNKKCSNEKTKTKTKQVVSTQDEAGLATRWVSSAASGSVGTSRRGRGLWLLLLLLLLPLHVVRTLIICLFLAIFTLLSLVPDQGCPRVVDGGQFRLRVLGEEKRLLAPPKRGRGLPTQGSCRCSGGWIVPPMSMGVLRFCKDAGGHLALALGGQIVICAEGEARVPAWRS